jgi:AAA15 family ATPase/GTPase
MINKSASLSYFTVHVENFGKIRTADIELSPLTLFVGDNNSGKSYLLVLLYGLLSPIFDELMRNGLKTRREAFLPLIKGLLQQERMNENYLIKEQEIRELEKIVNEVLFENKEELVETIFNKKIEIGDLRLEFHYNASAAPIAVCFSERESLQAEDDINMTILPNGGNGSVTTMTKDPELKDVTLIFMHQLIKALMIHAFCLNPSFLPASRTGFVLTYKLLLGDSIQRAYSIAGRKMTDNVFLTAPTLDFIVNLGGFSSNIESNRTENEAIIRFMENHILNGKLELSSVPAPDILFRPYGTGIPLSMHVSSAVVTETAPLLLYLRKQRLPLSCLLIEEPEMCLHPKLQQVMARVLIKITHSGSYGVPVVAATHSDIITQHVNNMLRLSQRTNRVQIMESFGYGEDDLLNEGDVRVYQFTDNGTYTSVEKLPWDEENGFVANTFVNALNSFLDETIEITAED